MYVSTRAPAAQRTSNLPFSRSSVPSWMPMSRNCGVVLLLRTDGRFGMWGRELWVHRGRKAEPEEKKN